MKKLVCAFMAVIFLFNILTGQQKIDYEITAKLDTLNHLISAEQIITYHNNSGAELNELYVHLWANAFRSKSTSFAGKLLEGGNPDLYFLKSDELGGYRELVFSQNGQILETIPVDKDEEIMIVKLKNPVKSGNVTSINAKYVLKIQKDILGFGFSDNYHIMANWYPKVAVYHNNNWEYHQLNASNLLYSDFGNYSITMITPASLTLIASGADKEFPIKTEFKGNLINQNDSFQKKQYIASDVTDFSWIATDNKLKKVKLQLIEIQEKLVTNIYYTETDSLYNPLMINDIRKSLIFSDKRMKVGIPENLNIIIDKGIKTPSSFQDIITLNHSKSRRDVYNDRDLLIKNMMKQNLQNTYSLNSPEFPWLYDGFSSYYQTRFLTSGLIGESERNRYFLSIQDKIKEILQDCIYKTASLNIDEYSNNRQKQVFLNYQTDINLNYLTQRTETDIFDTAMSNFFERYKKTNVSPAILHAYLDTAGTADHSWFFEGVMKNRNAFAYRIESVSKEQNLKKVRIYNSSPYAVPYRLELLDGKSVLETIEVPGHTGMKEFTFENQGGNKIAIDHENTILKSYDSKTIYFTKNRLKNLELFNFFRKPGPTNGILPMAGYNANDGLLLGTTILSKDYKNLFHRTFIFWGLKSKSPVGFFNWSYKMLECCNEDYFIFKLNGSAFNRLTIKNDRLKYYMISPQVDYVFNLNENKGNMLSYKFIFIKDQSYGSEGIESYNRYINRIGFNNKGGNYILNYRFNASLEHQYYNLYEKRQYLMVNSEMNSRFMYKKDRYLKFRFYGATYLYNTHTNSTGTHPGTLSLIGYNINDYAYEHPLFFDRSAQEGFGIRQLTNNTGGFKTGISNSYGIGQSNKYVAALNFRMDLPFKTVFKPFFDIGIYGDLPTVNEGYSNKFLYSAGILIYAELFEIYLPLINSGIINDAFEDSKIPLWNKISFYLKLND